MHLPTTPLQAAELIVALTNSDQKKAAVSAALARKSMSALSGTYQKKVEAVWDEANKKALGLINVVLANNPKKPKEQILKRPDIQAVLRQPYVEAAQKAESILREAWGAAEKDAVQKTKAEFKLLNAKWEGYELDESLLDSLANDLYANAQSVRERASKALTGDSPGSSLSGVINDTKRRASFTLTTGVWGANTMVRDSAFTRGGLNKLWLAKMDGVTCKHCKWHHGTIVGPGQAFPLLEHPPLKVYRGLSLLGPPRHPRCRCIVVGAKLKKTKPKKQTAN